MIDFYIIMTIVNLDFYFVEYTFSANEPLSFICTKYYSRSTVPLYSGSAATITQKLKHFVKSLAII